MLKNIYFIVAVSTGLLLGGCTAGVNDTGVEYAPQMYHSTPYEPLSQIKDESAGTWLDSYPNDGHGEFYNSNPYNPSGMTMLSPVENTIPRGWPLPNHIVPTDYETAAATLENPFEPTSEVIVEGKGLYERFCIHCHGPNGKGPAEGSVGARFGGVTSYISAAVKDKPNGHIFHVITYGKGRMGPHGSQLSEEERWKLVRYVETLQNQ